MAMGVDGWLPKPRELCQAVAEHFQLAQAEATKEAQRAGIAHAKANGDARAYKGRKPSYSRKQFESAQAMPGKSASVGEVARAQGLTRQTVYRIKDDAAAAEAALATWGI